MGSRGTGGRRRPQGPRSLGRRGYVLLVSLGMLALMAILGVGFVTVSMHEAIVAHNYIDQVRARMLAEAGIERAVGELTGIDMNQPWSGQFYQDGAADPYGETDHDAPYLVKLGGAAQLNPPGLLGDPASGVSQGKDRWFFGELFDPARPIGPTDIPPGLEIPAVGSPIKIAKWVSFPVSDGKSPPDVHTKTTAYPGGATITWGVSGDMGGTYAANPTNPGDVYSLKVLDCASMIYVNDDLTPAPADATLPPLPQARRTERLQGILDSLGKVCGVPGLGAKVLGAARPVEGWASKRQLADLAFAGQTDPLWLRVRDFLTTHAWSDPTTVRFNAAVNNLAGTFTQRGIAYAEPRAPLNMNTAAREVLISVLAGIGASYPQRVNADYPGVNVNWIDTAMPAAPVSPATNVCTQIADWIIERRCFDPAPPFMARGYPHGDWMHVCEDTFNSLNGANGAPNLSIPEREMLRAQFNPNSDIKKYNPDIIFVDPNISGRTDFTLTDKSDLTHVTTEFCFGSMGFYEIECVGRVCAPEPGSANVERIMGECKISTIVKTHDVYRASNQADFEKNRVPGPKDNYTNAATRGAFLQSVVSLPEYPHNRGPLSAAVPTPSPDWAAGYDGQLILNGFVNHRGTPQSFLAGYSDGKLDAIQGPGPLKPGGNARAQPSILGQDIYDGSDLYPFGVQIDSQRRITGGAGRWMDLNAANFPKKSGTIEFWIKPEVDLLGNTSAPKDTWFRQRVMVLSAAKSATQDAFRIFFENGAVRAFFFWGSGGQSGPYIFLSGPLTSAWLPHTWHHIEAAYEEAPGASDPGGGGDPKGGGAGGEPAPGGGGAPADGGTAWLFVDGNMVESKPIPRGINNVPNFYIAAYTLPDHDSTFKIAENVVATLDNVCAHPIVLHKSSFTPRSRYHDLSAQAYTYDAVAGRPPGSDVNGKHGEYWKRLVEIETAANSLPVTIGTLSCTHWHPPHLHSRGSHTSGIPDNGLGHVTVTLLKTPSGTGQAMLPYDNCAGVRAVALNVPGDGRVRIQRTGGLNDELTYIVKMELAENGALPHNNAPIVDDFTITYFTRPVFQEWTWDMP